LVSVTSIRLTKDIGFKKYRKQWTEHRK